MSGTTVESCWLNAAKCTFSSLFVGSGCDRRGHDPSPSSDTQLALLWRCCLLQHTACRVFRKGVLGEGGGEGILQGTVHGQAQKEKWSWAFLLSSISPICLAPNTCPLGSGKCNSANARDEESTAFPGQRGAGHQCSPPPSCMLHRICSSRQPRPRSMQGPSAANPFSSTDPISTTFLCWKAKVGLNGLSME